MKLHHVTLEKIENPAGRTVFSEGYTWPRSEQAIFAFQTAKQAYNAPVSKAAFVVNLYVGETAIDSFWLEQNDYRELTKICWSEARPFYRDADKARGGEW